MNIFFQTEKDSGSRLQYAIQFIAEVLGYPYDVGDKSGKYNVGHVLVRYGSREIKKSEENTTVIEIYDSGLMYNLEELEKKVDLFEWRNRAWPILGQQVADQDLKGWRLNKVTGFYARNNGRHILIPFDLYANIFYHLSRYEEKWRHFAEETITDHSTSVLARHQSLDDPLVDALIAYLDVIIRKSLGPFIKVLPWPGGQPFAIAFTHDIDLTRGAPLKKRLLHRGFELISKIGANRESAEGLKEEIAEEDAQVWTYPQLLDLYKRYNCKASFYFLVRMFEGMHFRYNIASRKFRSLIDQLAKSGHEIGLHSSLKAFDKSGKYAEERQSLDHVSGRQSIGLRQHYLRAKFPRLWQLAADAGFVYDTSLGYNYQYGFRAGTCHPFRCYNYKTDKIIPLWEFSLAFFENNLPKDLDNPEELIAVVERIIGKVEQYEGLVVGLMHPSNFLQTNYNRLWEWLLKQVEHRGAYSATLSEIHDWLAQRTRIEMKVISENEIRINKPAAMKTFAIEIDEKKSLQPSTDYKVEQISGNRYRLASARKSLVLYLA